MSHIRETLKKYPDLRTSVRNAFDHMNNLRAAGLERLAAIMQANRDDLDRAA
jgi:hypothetical protein